MKAITDVDKCLSVHLQMPGQAYRVIAVSSYRRLGLFESEDNTTLKTIVLADDHEAADRITHLWELPSRWSGPRAPAAGATLIAPIANPTTGKPNPYD